MRCEQPECDCCKEASELMAYVAALEVALRPFAEAYRRPQATSGVAIFVPREAWVRAAELVKD